MFRNRMDAAEALTQALAPLNLQQPLVLAIPRGAVPMARVIADTLRGELDVVLVRKLGAPGNPEYAIGAVSEQGDITLRPGSAATYGEHYIEAEVAEQSQRLQQRRAQYTPVRRPVSAAGRHVIVVDDGGATGATMEAALKAVRAQRPAWLVAALAVAPPEVVQRLEAQADAVVCLHAPPHFYAVGQFFEDFSQVSDEDVVRLLAQTGEPGSAAQ